MTMFTIKAEVEGVVAEYPYNTFDQFFTGEELPLLCGNGMIDSCAIYQNGNEIVPSLPKMLISWERLRDQVISNSSTILRSHYEK